MSLMKLKHALEKQKPFCSAGGGGGDGSSSASSSPLKMRTSKVTVSKLIFNHFFLVIDDIVFSYFRLHF
jgi:hypothetical protein